LLPELFEAGAKAGHGRALTAAHQPANSVEGRHIGQAGGGVPVVDETGLDTDQTTPGVQPGATGRTDGRGPREVEGANIVAAPGLVLVAGSGASEGAPKEDAVAIERATVEVHIGPRSRERAGEGDMGIGSASTWEPDQRQVVCRVQGHQDGWVTAQAPGSHLEAPALDEVSCGEHQPVGRDDDTGAVQMPVDEELDAGLGGSRVEITDGRSEARRHPEWERKKDAEQNGRSASHVDHTTV